MNRVDLPYIPTSAFDVSGYVLTPDDGIVQVKRAFATGATIGTHTLVAAVTDKKITVLQYLITTVDGLNLVFKSGATTISGNIAATGAMSPYCPHGFFQTTAGAALGFNIDAAESTSVHILYVEVS
jgi:hypothetical protein